MAKKLFNTIYGRNLVGELKNIVKRPYLVVTMEDLWETFKEEFDEDCIVHFLSLIHISLFLRLAITVRWNGTESGTLRLWE